MNEGTKLAVGHTLGSHLEGGGALNLKRNFQFGSCAPQLYAHLPPDCKDSLIAGTHRAGSKCSNGPFFRPKEPTRRREGDFLDTPPSFLRQYSDFALASVGLPIRQRQRPDPTHYLPPVDL